MIRYLSFFLINLLYILIIVVLVIAVIILYKGLEAYIKKNTFLYKQLYIYTNYYDFTNKWIKNYNEGIYNCEYFQRNNFKSIAIYGAGELGKRLYESLKDSKLDIVCFFDSRNEDMHKLDVPIEPIERIKDIDLDCVIITPFFDFYNIEHKIKNIDKEIKCISIEEVI